MYTGLPVKYTSLWSEFNKAFCRQILEKSLNIKFHEIPSSVSLFIPCGQKDE